MVLIGIVCVVAAFSLLNLMGFERAKMMAKVKSEAKHAPVQIAPAPPPPAPASPPAPAAASLASPKQPAKPPVKK